MFVLISLLRNGASSVPEQYYVNAVSKEAALSALVLEKGINLDKYSMVMVTDLTLHIHNAEVTTNAINVVIDNDFNSPTLDLVQAYDPTIEKSETVSEPTSENTLKEALDKVVKEILGMSKDDLESALKRHSYSPLARIVDDIQDFAKEFMKASQLKKDFKKFESEYYDFHRYFILVTENLITPLNLFIPNDLAFEAIYMSWYKFEYPSSIPDGDIYSVIIEYILKDRELLETLKSLHE